jgi:hypothetical protein
MLASLSIIIRLLCVGVTFPASSPAHQIDIHARATMQTQANIEAFIQSLQLASSPAQALVSKLRAARDGNGKTTYNAIGLACLVAQAALEAESVEITPVNQTKVDSNWSVALDASNFRIVMLTTVIKV